MGPAVTHRYLLYGLRLASDLPLPELIGDESEGDPDVRVRLQPTGVPRGCECDIHTLANGAGFRVADVGSYAILGGSEIRVEPECEAPARNVRLYLLGSAMGMLLHQRGLLPLHANAVEIGGRAIAFMGPPGEGKSTLAAWMARAGKFVLADDVCVLRGRPEGGHQVHPGLPRLRLWRSSLEGLGSSVEGYSRSYLGDDCYDKYDVPLASPGSGGVPLSAVFLLARGERLVSERLHGAEAVAALVENTYRGSYVPHAQGTERHWRQCMALASTVPVFRLRRPWNLDGLEGMTASLIDLCEELVREDAIACAPPGH